jgi:hypothetical protein
LAVSFAIVFFLSNGNAASAQRNSDAVPKREVMTPKWRVDLRSVIGGTPVPNVFGGNYEIKGAPEQSLWFTNNDTVVATFVVREGAPMLSKRNGTEVSSPLRLRAAFLDANDGNVTATPAWPTNSRLSRIVAAHDGNFVTQTGTQLTLYSSNLKEQKKLTLPSTDETRWSAHSSPTGRNILFTATNLRTTSAIPWIWVDVDSLSIVRSWREIQSGWISISDSTMAMTTCIWVYDCDQHVEVKSLGAEWKPLALFDRHHRPYPQFINDDTLVVRDFPTRLTLIRPTGEVLFTKEFTAKTEAQGWGIAFPSAGGQRFVIPAGVLKGAFPALDIGGHGVLKQILLYDFPFREPSYTLDLNPNIKELHTLFALSPDGQRLAILNDQFVEVFQLPPISQ